MEMKKEQVIGVATVVATSILMFAGNVSADGVTIGSSEPGISVEAPDKGGDAGVLIGKETTKPAPAEPSTKDGVIGENKKPDTQPNDVEKPKDEGKVTEPSQPIVSSDSKDGLVQPEAKPQEVPRVEETKKEEPQQAESQELPKPTEQPKSVTVTEEEIQAASIQTNTGHTVVGTSEGRVFVETADGTVTLKEAAEIGAVKQADGTVALKNDKGDLKVLPSTGEVSSVFGIIGGFILSVLGLAGYSYAKKHKEK
jgi:gram positive anchor domain protein